MTSLDLLIKNYEVLEAKQEDGTLTMDDESRMMDIYERMNSLLFKK